MQTHECRNEEQLQSRNAARLAAKKSLAERECWLAAVHEASHLVLVRRFGGYGYARVWPNESDNPEEKAWLARCWLVPPEDVRYARGAKRALGVGRTPARWRTYVGLAGFVGETFARGALCRQCIGEDLDFGLDAGEISETDRAMFGDSVPRDRLVLHTVDYVARWWREIESTAQTLETAALAMREQDKAQIGSSVPTRRRQR